VLQPFISEEWTVAFYGEGFVSGYQLEVFGALIYDHVLYKVAVLLTVMQDGYLIAQIKFNLVSSGTA
jgi:hypothetical protein